VRHFRDILVAGQVKENASPQGAALDYSAEISEKLKEQGSRIPAQRLIAYIHAFSETLRELRFAPHMRTALEVCALRLCSPVVLAEGGAPSQAQGEELAGLLSRIAKLERKVASLAEGPPVIADLTQHSQVPPIPAHDNAAGEALFSQQQTQPEAPSATQPPEESNPTLTGSLTPDLLSQIKSNWNSLANNLSPMLRSALLRCGLEADGAMLQIICDNESEVKFLKEKNRPMAIREAMAERFNLSTPPNLAFIVRDNYNKVAAKSNTRNSRETTPQYHASSIIPDAPFDPLFDTPSGTPPNLHPGTPQELTLDQVDDWSDFGQETNPGSTSPF